MANPSGNKKSNSRRKRTGSQPSQPKQQAQIANEAEQTGGKPVEQQIPASRRTNRKEEAQAQAKKKKQMQLIIGGVALAVIVAVIFVFVNRPTSSGVQIDYTGLEVSNSEVVTNAGVIASPQAEVPPLSFATGVTVGDPNAPVTMHIFSDFQCRFCLQFHDETLPQIVDDFVKTGQLKLVYHDFPRLGTDPSIADPNDLEVEMRDGNNESAAAAHAAMCAGEQDKYLEMSDKLFGNYSGVQQGGFARAKLNRFAEDLNLDMGAFGECMDSGRYMSAIADSVAQGQANGITATPMFILDNGNGEPNLIQQTAEGYTLLKKQIELSIQTAP